MKEIRRRLFRARRSRPFVRASKMIVRHRQLGRVPQATAHRGWLAQHGGHRPPNMSVQSSRVENGGLSFPLTLVAASDVDSAARDDAAAAVRHVAAFAPYPVLQARISLTRHRDHAVQRPAVVEASLGLRHHAVRARAKGRTFPDAVDLLERRLRRRLEDIGRLAKTRRRSGASARDSRRLGS